MVAIALEVRETVEAVRASFAEAFGKLKDNATTKIGLSYDSRYFRTAFTLGTTAFSFLYIYC